MKTPTGVELKVGQRWQEVDPRFDRVVEVLGWSTDAGKVQIRGLGERRISWANVSRFNGKLRGYAPLEVT